MTRPTPTASDLLQALSYHRDALHQLRVLRRRRTLAAGVVQNARSRLRIALTSLDIYLGQDPRASSRFAAVRFAAVTQRVQTYFTLEALSHDRNAVVRLIARRRLAELNRDTLGVDLDAPAADPTKLPPFLEEYVL